MKKSTIAWIPLTALLVALVAGVPAAGAAPAPDRSQPAVHGDDRYEMEGCVTKKDFTDSQKKKLAKLFDRQYENMKAILDTYEEYGAISPEQKRHRLAMLKDHMEMVKENGYRWCHEIERENGEDMD